MRTKFCVILYGCKNEKEMMIDQKRKTIPSTFKTQQNATSCRAIDLTFILDEIPLTCSYYC